MDVSDCKQTVDNPLRSLLLMNSLPETGHSRSSTNDPQPTLKVKPLSGRLYAKRSLKKAKNRHSIRYKPATQAGSFVQSERSVHARRHSGRE